MKENKQIDTSGIFTFKGFSLKYNTEVIVKINFGPLTEKKNELFAIVSNTPGGTGMYVDLKGVGTDIKSALQMIAEKENLRPLI